MMTRNPDGRAVTIKGVEYRGVFVSLAIFERGVVLEKKLDVAKAAFDNEPSDATESEYDRVWGEYCSCFLFEEEAKVRSELSRHELGLQEAIGLRSFFGQLVGLTIPT
jgi:hypothetical protein